MQRVWLAILLTASAPVGRGADWVSIRSGPFVVFSDAGAKETRRRTAQLEQFRYSLGELLGKHDLVIDPPLEIFFSTQPIPRAEGPTRTGATALIQGATDTTPATFSSLAYILLNRNVGRMPADLEHGLAAFLSTTRVDGTRVTWGDPPAPAMRTRDWALVDWLVTNPDTYGKFRVFLANVQNDVEMGVAYRNSLGQSPADVARAVEAYLKAGVFATIDAPSRPLSADRDLIVRAVPADDMNLCLADLLLADSESRYRDVLNSGKHKAEAEEGLGLLAARRGDAGAAADFLAKAVADGSRNAAALVAYARIEQDPVKARAALDRALTIDTNSAEAHFVLGQKLTARPLQIQQWQIAVQLAPRDQIYWVTLAQALQTEKRWGDAAKAWRGAEQAAATAVEREKMLLARLGIDGLRLDDEAAQRRAEQEAKQAEITRLKKEAIAEIRAAEAKANGGAAPHPEVAGRSIAWAELAHGPVVHVDGMLTGVNCAGRKAHLLVKTPDGQMARFAADLVGLKLKLTCGIQKVPRRVAVDYTGEMVVVALSFPARQQPR